MKQRELFIDAMAGIDQSLLREHIERRCPTRTQKLKKYALAVGAYAAAILVVAVALPFIIRTGVEPNPSPTPNTNPPVVEPSSELQEITIGIEEAYTEYDRRVVGNDEKIPVNGLEMTVTLPGDMERNEDETTYISYKNDDSVFAYAWAATVPDYFVFDEEAISVLTPVDTGSKPIYKVTTGETEAVYEYLFYEVPTGEGYVTMHLYVRITDDYMVRMSYVLHEDDRGEFETFLESIRVKTSEMYEISFYVDYALDNFSYDKKVFISPYDVTMDIPVCYVNENPSATGYYRAYPFYDDGNMVRGFEVGYAYRVPYDYVMDENVFEDTTPGDGPEDRESMGGFEVDGLPVKTGKTEGGYDYVQYGDGEVDPTYGRCSVHVYVRLADDCIISMSYNISEDKYHLVQKSLDSIKVEKSDENHVTGMDLTTYTDYLAGYFHENYKMGDAVHGNVLSLVSRFLYEYRYVFDFVEFNEDTSMMTVPGEDFRRVARNLLGEDFDAAEHRDWNDGGTMNKYNGDEDTYTYDFATDYWGQDHVYVDEDTPVTVIDGGGKDATVSAMLYDAPEFPYVGEKNTYEAVYTYESVVDGNFTYYRLLQVQVGEPEPAVTDAPVTDAPVTEPPVADPPVTSTTGGTAKPPVADDGKLFDPEVEKYETPEAITVSGKRSVKAEAFGCKYTLTVDRDSYTAGMGVSATVTFENNSGSPITMYHHRESHFMDSMYLYADGTWTHCGTVYRGYSFADVIVSDVIKPGEKLTFKDIYVPYEDEKALNASKWEIRASRDFYITVDGKSYYQRMNLVLDIPHSGLKQLADKSASGTGKGELEALGCKFTVSLDRQMYDASTPTAVTVAFENVSNKDVIIDFGSLYEYRAALKFYAGDEWLYHGYDDGYDSTQEKDIDNVLSPGEIYKFTKIFYPYDPQGSRILAPAEPADPSLRWYVTIDRSVISGDSRQNMKLTVDVPHDKTSSAFTTYEPLKASGEGTASAELFGCKYTAALDKSRYGKGDEITLTQTLTNTAKESIVITGTVGKYYLEDFGLYVNGVRIKGYSSQERGITDGGKRVQIYLEPGETKTFTAVYKPHDPWDKKMPKLDVSKDWQFVTRCHLIKDHKIQDIVLTVNVPC